MSPRATGPATPGVRPARRQPAVRVDPRVATARPGTRGTVGRVDERAGTVPRRRPGQEPTARRAATPARPAAAVPPARGGGGRPPVRGGGRPPAPAVPPTVVASRPRMLTLVVVLALVLVTFAGRLVHVQVLAGPELAQEARENRMTTASVIGARGEVTDANGVVLATSVERYDISVNQQRIARYQARGSTVGLDGAAGVAARLAPLLDMNAAELGGKLVGDRPFVYVKKNVLPEVAREIRALRIDGVNVDKVPDRVYPKGTVAGNIVGFVNSEGVGLQGLESSLDEKLRGVKGTERFERGKGGQPIPGGASEQTPARDGSSVRLTLDSDLQWKAEEELRKQVAAMGATGGTVVVMRPTGEVLALAESTAFDPNDPGALGTGSLTRSVSDVFEPGSTGKVVTMAAALEEGLVGPTDRFTVADRLTTPNGQTFKDSHDHPVQQLTATGVFAESSNTGTIQIGERLSLEQRHRYLSLFGFGSRTGIEIPGESGGILHPYDEWDGRSQYAVLFGQAVSVNALQAASVFATIANGGVRVAPHLVAGWTDPDGAYAPRPAPEGTRVVSEQTAGTVLSMMESVVDDGTGGNAAIPGYRVAGKTGTAQKFAPAGITASFIGVAPADDPQVVTAVILHDPSASIFGGTAAAPVFSTVTSYALQQLGVAPSGTPASLFPATWE
ncbi:penicillin-binding protein 2 [Cellulomonas sp. zg-ZUI222]|uniref:Penicillin-binding protein 2 n=1 Tax=Cellulomonas wangleii TaxID=2816956 RepID=A0ABX8D954_9CELL|nr:penicillin-binding protein 2 [Cellulomonas wangleii]MBO0900621.1 penicillin-binding protein 2 [Cellulomonas sp. zg-ZUI22]MBO0921289.1 penicillin-binding protein 2 [Cellulomonas wangleii]MBO0925705.1 penicillin-binding protein 2 [Cellulomonas wangleii]QVI63766.1 penicillin-binding protein 2 [Cellulomonas wangleii]